MKIPSKDLNSSINIDISELDVILNGVKIDTKQRRQYVVEFQSANCEIMKKLLVLQIS